MITLEYDLENGRRRLLLAKNRSIWVVVGEVEVARSRIDASQYALLSDRSDA